MTRQERLLAGLATTAAVLAVAARLARERQAVSLEGRVVLITGGSRGLGLELARAFANRGAKLALLARDEAELQRAQDELATQAARVLIVPADVRQADEMSRAVDRVVTHYGRLDVLVNNAGIILTGPLEHMTLDDFDQALKVHYWGPLHAMIAALPYLRRVQGGRIVNIASIGGKIAVPHLAPYSGSKFALVGLSDAFRAELAPTGIRVTTVCPGLMRTGSPFNASFKGHHAEEFTWFSIADSLPVVSVSSRRAADEIVEACRFGAPSLVIGRQARLAVAVEGLMPGLVGRMTQLAASLLPGPNPAGGEQARLGRDSRSRWAPSLLTRLSERAAERNNEARAALPISSSTTARATLF